MNVVSENCTRAVIFSHGKICAEGTPKEIFSDYERLVGLGLDLPVTAYLERALDKAGLKIDSDLTVDDFVQKVAKEFNGGER